MSQHPPSARYSQILMSNHARPLHLQRIRVLAILLPLAALLMIATACGGTINPTQNGTGALAANQVLILPNVGTQDIGVLDPALGADANSAIAVGMIYSGLVKSDQTLNVLPDQATWQISPDNKVYTFHLKSGITFSDGTPITAQTYGPEYLQ
jgi:oligopeptide transport system substrate-binding protein